MQRTDNGTADSKPPEVQYSGSGPSGLATASLYMGIFGLAFPIFFFLAVMGASSGLVLFNEISSAAAALIMGGCLFLLPLSSVGGLLLGIVARVRVARSQSQTIAKQTASVGIFASASAIILMVGWSMVIPSLLAVR